MADHTRLPSLSSSQPIFAARDVVEAVRFYRDTLGFTDEWLWGDPPDFGGVCWGKVGVMFCLDPDLARQIEGHMHSIFVNNVAALYERHRAAGAPIVSPLEAKPWGLREYTVRDPNGYHLRFGEHAGARSGEAKQALPEGARLVERLPNLDEYTRLIDAVGWRSFVNFDVVDMALSHSLYSVVAVVGDEVIGMARVVGDGASFFYVQDVMVLPAYQKKGVGTLLMDAVMDYLRREAPRQAFIGLFTGRGLGGFYDRWGFEGAETSLYGMSVKKRDDLPPRSR